MPNRTPNAAPTPSLFRDGKRSRIGNPPDNPTRTVPLSPDEVKCSAATLGENCASSRRPFFPWRRLRFKVSPGERELAMRMMGVLSLVAVCGLLVCAPARAGHVPPFKGNDTGGIIAYPPAAQTDARQLAVAHCAAYGKVVKFLSVDPEYGGHNFFSRPWGPSSAPPLPLRPLYSNRLYSTRLYR